MRIFVAAWVCPAIVSALSLGLQARHKSATTSGAKTTKAKAGSSSKSKRPRKKSAENGQSKSEVEKLREKVRQMNAATAAQRMQHEHPALTAKQQKQELKEKRAVVAKTVLESKLTDMGLGAGGSSQAGSSSSSGSKAEQKAPKGSSSKGRVRKIAPAPVAPIAPAPAGKIGSGATRTVATNTVPPSNKMFIPWMQPPGHARTVNAEAQSRRIEEAVSSPRRRAATAASAAFITDDKTSHLPDEIQEISPMLEAVDERGDDVIVSEQPHDDDHDEEASGESFMSDGGYAKYVEQASTRKTVPVAGYAIRSMASWNPPAVQKDFDSQIRERSDASDREFRFDFPIEPAARGTGTPLSSSSSSAVANVGRGAAGVTVSSNVEEYLSACLAEAGERVTQLFWSELDEIGMRFQVLVNLYPQFRQHDLFFPDYQPTVANVLDSGVDPTSGKTWTFNEYVHWHDKRRSVEYSILRFIEWVEAHWVWMKELPNYFERKSRGPFQQYCQVAMQTWYRSPEDVCTGGRAEYLRDLKNIWGRDAYSTRSVGCMFRKYARAQWRAYKTQPWKTKLAGGESFQTFSSFFDQAYYTEREQMVYASAYARAAAAAAAAGQQGDISITTAGPYFAAAAPIIATSPAVAARVVTTAPIIPRWKHVAVERVQSEEETNSERSFASTNGDVDADLDPDFDLNDDGMHLVDVVPDTQPTTPKVHSLLSLYQDFISTNESEAAFCLPVSSGSYIPWNLDDIRASVARFKQHVAIVQPETLCVDGSAFDKDVWDQFWSHLQVEYNQYQFAISISPDDVECFSDFLSRSAERSDVGLTQDDLHPAEDGSVDEDMLDQGNSNAFEDFQDWFELEMTAAEAPAAVANPPSPGLTARDSGSPPVMPSTSGAGGEGVVSETAPVEKTAAIDATSTATAVAATTPTVAATAPVVTIDPTKISAASKKSGEWGENSSPTSVTTMA